MLHMMACLTAVVILILKLRLYLSDRLVNPLRFEEGRYVHYTREWDFLDAFRYEHSKNSK